MRSYLNRQLISAAAFVCLLQQPAIAACTVPNQLTNGQTASATALMQDFGAVAACADSAAPAGGAGSVQYKAANGSFGAAPLSSGQLLIGATSGAPVAASLSAGPGVSITSSSGAVTISAVATTAASAVDWLNEGAVLRPIASTFSLQTSSISPAGASLAPTVRGMVLTTNSATDGAALMAETAAPSGAWQATMLAIYSGPIATFSFPAIAVRDASANRAVEFGIEGNGTASYRFAYIRSAGGMGLDTVLSETNISDIGLPPPSQPFWSRLTYDGTNLSWSFSRDGEFFVTAFSIPARDNLTTLSKVGPAALFRQPTNASWSSAYHILSWSVTAL